MRRSIEFSTLLGFAPPADAIAAAQRAERDGWDALYTVDSQNLSPDAIVNLTVMAQATTTLRFGTWVSNPLTRHPALIASAFHALSMLSGGRAVLSVGRGDSALAYIGKGPAPVADFDRYIQATQRYLSGQGVPFELIDHWGHGGSIADLPLANRPEDSRLRFWEPTHTKVPLGIAATGPRVIAIGARHCDRVTFGLGADPERIRWAIDLARREAEAAGRDPATLSFGAGFTLVPIADLPKARRIAAASVASQARFSAIHGNAVGPASDAKKAVFESVVRNYNMNRHGKADSQVTALTDEFIDTFAVVGSPSRCIERIEALIALGLDHFVFYPSMRFNNVPEEEREIYPITVGDVLPQLRRST